MVCKKIHRLPTDLHIKPTDRHQCRHYFSSHPYHNKKSIIYNQTLKLSVICSKENDCVKHNREIISWLLKLGYPKTVKTEMEKRKFRQILVGRGKGITKGLPLVLTNHQLLK